jgi:hypothetical protein
LNGDSFADLAVVSAGANTVSVLLGNGDGSFHAPVAYATGNFPDSVAVGDLDGNGTPDLAVTNEDSGTVTVWRNRGDGTFQAGGSYTAGFRPDFVAMGNFDGDGFRDLAVADATAPGAVTVLLNAANWRPLPLLNPPYPISGRPIVSAPATSEPVLQRLDEPARPVQEALPQIDTHQPARLEATFSTGHMFVARHLRDAMVAREWGDPVGVCWQ